MPSGVLIRGGKGGRLWAGPRGAAEQVPAWMPYPALLFRDSFGRADHANLGTADSPAIAWPNDVLSSILSNKAHFALGAGQASNVPFLPSQISVFDVDLEVTVTADNATSADFEVLVRGRVTGGLSIHDFVRCGINTSNDTLAIAEKVNSGATTGLGSVSLVLVPGTVYRIRFQAVSSLVRAKVWVDGAAEPTAWDITGTTTVLGPGSIGLMNFATTAVNIDWGDLTIGEPGYFDPPSDVLDPLGMMGYYGA